MVCGGVGVVVVVLVEVGFGVGLRSCVARRFINADTYIAYISMCMGLCVWRHTPSGSVEMRHRPRWMFRDGELKCVSVDGDCGGQSRRS